MKTWAQTWGVLAPALLALSACGGSGGSGAPKAAPVEIKIAGSTFSQAAYQRWAEAFMADPEHKGIKIHYQPSSSGAAIRQLLEGTVDIAATSMPVSDEELAKFKVPPVHVPTLTGAIVIACNVPGLRKDIRLSGQTLANIYLGRVREWNDPDIVIENPGVDLPPTSIAVLHRSDVSGSTYAFTHYLAKASAAFEKSVGKGGSVKFPVGKGFPGSEELADAVAKTPNSIGYMERGFAAARNLRVIAVKNPAGEFLKADLAGMAAASDAVTELPPDLRISILNTPPKNAYPITTYAWFLVPSQIPDTAKRRAIKIFIRWAHAAGQNEAMSLDYGTLPQAVSKAALKLVDAIH
ncbi:MAG: phosphate ABC transporter substrate-binding protein PstS [Bryobacteraceae bacterium]|nr:phosphate ABC transporter substrate-binding protein PstS [Bryobacteraceae bacterium]MDW8378172.1 phosphate ABC transporter substrate-binding protein PstS [Bryobacterales bacterium]